MLTQEDLQNIETIFDRRFNNLENRFDNLENRIDSFENLTNKKFDAIIERIDVLESETTKSFALLENDMLPKITALFDAHDLYVTKQEFRKYQETADSKLQYIDPLVVKTKSLSESVRKLEEHQETA